jgi:hypothetical protein
VSRLMVDTRIGNESMGKWCRRACIIAFTPATRTRSLSRIIIWAIERFIPFLPKTQNRERHNLHPRSHHRAAANPRASYAPPFACPGLRRRPSACTPPAKLRILTTVDSLAEVPSSRGALRIRLDLAVDSPAVRAAPRPREQAGWRPLMPFPVTGRLQGRHRVLLLRRLRGAALWQGRHGCVRERCI